MNVYLHVYIRFYAKVVQRMGFRTNCKNCDFSDILGDEAMEETLKKSAETSMGTEISDSDLLNISSLCEQVISLSEYRIQFFDYLKNAIAPNLTVMMVKWRSEIDCAFRILVEFGEATWRLPFKFWVRRRRCFEY